MGRKSRLKRERREAKAAAAAVEESARAADRMQARTDAATGRARGCLFCRGSEGGFTSREHIVPEGLGNRDDLVLPRGVVCDRCNNGVCSRLDAALTDFGPFAFMKTMAGIPSKRGALPSFAFDNGRLTATAPGELSLELDSQRWRKPDKPRPDGRVEWGFTSKRQDATPKRLSLVHRALVKMALECTWIDLEPEEVLSEKFDRERQLVLTGGHSGYLVVPKIAQPTEELSITYQQLNRAEDGQPFLGIGVSFWGVIVVTDSLLSSPVRWPPASDAAVLTFP